MLIHLGQHNNYGIANTINNQNVVENQVGNITNTTNEMNNNTTNTTNTVNNETKKQTSTNPKTGDVITVSVILLITAILGVFITNRMKMTNGK